MPHTDHCHTTTKHDIGFCVAITLKNTHNHLVDVVYDSDHFLRVQRKSTMISLDKVTLHLVPTLSMKPSWHTRILNSLPTNMLILR